MTYWLISFGKLRISQKDVREVWLKHLSVEMGIETLPPWLLIFSVASVLLWANNFLYLSLKFYLLQIGVSLLLSCISFSYRPQGSYKENSLHKAKDHTETRTVMFPLWFFSTHYILIFRTKNGLRKRKNYIQNYFVSYH